MNRLYSISWIVVVFFCSLIMTPRLFPACNTTYCNWGSEISEYCGPAGACEFPEYCKMVDCQNNSCSPPVSGYIRYCVLQAYCTAYPNCNGGCPSSGC
jgi:hypothetical protein